MSFQENLRLYRERAGYTQAKEFAAAIGLKYTTYIAYENQGKEPKYDTLRRIAAALNVSTDMLLGVSGIGDYEEHRQLLERSGCHVTENAGRVIVTLPISKILGTHTPERNMLVHGYGVNSTHPPHIAFTGKASLCACMAGIVAEFDNMLAPAKVEYISLALLRYAMKQETSTQDAPPDTAALIGKKILAASPAAQAAINEIIRDDEKE